MMGVVEWGLKQILANRAVKRVREAGRLLSAVLLPLYFRDGEYYLLFTKRTELVQEHKGQISFPGGTYETADGSLLSTALRECREELGLAPEDVRVLGRLDDRRTRTSNYIIAPFVAVIPWPYDFMVNGSEIEEIIEVPVAALLDGHSVHYETEVFNGQLVSAISYSYRGRVIWGATARMLAQFLDVYQLAMEQMGQPE